MTLEDFNNIVDSYGLYKRNGYISLSGFFEKDTCGDAPVVTFYVKVKKNWKFIWTWIIILEI